MNNLNITLEEEKLEKIFTELYGPKAEEVEANIDANEEVHKDIVLRYKCDICNNRVMIPKGLKLHMNRMHEKSL